MGPIEVRVRENIAHGLEPVHVELVNESSKHNVPPNSETHFRIFIVARKFEGLPRIERQRLVHDLLKGEMGKGLIHALTLRLMTPHEWSESGTVEVSSPPCFGKENK